jgi:DNA repair protein RadA/Sms
MKNRIQYVCSKCASSYPKWQGQCGGCGEWNTLSESITQARAMQAVSKRYSNYAGETQLATLASISVDQQNSRWSSCDPELDRVLGGGLVEGSVVLLGGDPGIGKSTLLLSTAAALAQSHPVLYVSGEESLQQIALRAQRLNIPELQNLTLMAETRLEELLSQISKSKPKCVIVDSIQTLATEASASAAGTVSQLRDCTAALVSLAKQMGIAIILIGHVTKQGQIAGPRVLEHMVDTVLYFESDPSSRYRFIRAVKNRFGAADELAVFAMLENGLKPVSNPSAIFLQQRENIVAGSIYFANRQGTRQLIIEIQALVDQSPVPQSRRVAVGLDTQRLNMLLAILHRHASVALFDYDVYINAVGGLKATETASDLAVIMAVMSAFDDKAWAMSACAFGEVGLSGEIRPVPYGLERLEEMARQGFKYCYLPKANLPKKALKGMKCIGLEHVSELCSLNRGV